MAESEPDPLTPIPLVVLTGFLGAGKTTRLNAWLRDAALADTLVVINEFGEVGLDHLLVETTPEDVVLMAAGCLCCTVRGDLVATLEDLLRRRDNRRIRFFQRLLIETTGLADPLPILQAVLQHPYLSKRFAIAGLVTLVDAVSGATTIAAHPEARRQVALADALLLTKTDLADPAGLAGLRAEIRALNPIVTPQDDNERPFPADALFAPRFSAARTEDIASWLGTGEEAAHQAGAIASLTLTAEHPVPEGALTVFREAMRMLHGPRLLRMKGIVALAEDPEHPVAIHQVQSVVHPPLRLPRWPSRDRRTRIVCITQDIAPGTIEGFWTALVARGG
jgi:G3E family GTPase